jgi:hypothetical protein
MAIVLVQSTIAVVVGSQSTNLAYTSNLTAGSLLVMAEVAFAGSGGNAASGTPTDTRSHTWSGARANYAPINASNAGRIWYVPAASSGTCTVTNTIIGSVGVDQTLAISEWSGAHASPLGAAGEQGDGTGTGTAVATGTTGTLAQADELIVGWVSHTGADTTIAHDAADGFATLQENEGGSANMPLNVQYKITSATTAIIPNWTLGASRNWFGQSVTFIAAAAGAQDTPELYGRPFGLRGETQLHQLLAQ